jgi:hypothetical protein
MSTEDAAGDGPGLPESRLEFRGPYESHDVVFKGRQVPFLRADLLDGGRIDITLDRRFGLVLSTAEAERFIPFLAHAIAVASGYTCHPSGDQEPNPRHHFPRVRPLLLDEG